MLVKYYLEMDLIGYNRVFKDIFVVRIEDQPLQTRL